MKKIRNKLVFTMMVLTLLPALLIGAYSLYSTAEVLRENALKDQRHHLNQVMQSIQSQLSGVERDLLFLRDSSAMQLYLAARVSSRQRSRILLENLKNSAQLFSQQQQIYAAIRLLDRQGNELLRIENQQGEAKSLSDPTALKNLAGRDYVKQASRLLRGQVYISPLELRRDQEGILIPHQPTLRYATVVNDKDGSPQGLLVLNVNAQQLIDQSLVTEKNTWTTLFTDPDGYFFHHPDTELRWSGPDNLDSGHNIFKDEQLSVDRLQGSDQAGTVVSSQSVTLSQPILLGTNRPVLGYLFSVAPKQTLFKALQDYFTVSLIIAAVSLVLSFAFALILANSLSDPLVRLKKQVEHLSQGDLDTPITTTAKNEIGDLSRAVELLRKSMNILMKRTRKASS